MEYIEGVSLVEFMQDRNKIKPDENRLRLICKKLINIIASLHFSGIAHCDIKPGNIILAADGDVKLIDFGFATDLQDTNGFTEQTCGT